jgi:hypothetical protein
MHRLRSQTNRLLLGRFQKPNSGAALVLTSIATVLSLVVVLSLNPEARHVYLPLVLTLSAAAIVWFSVSYIDRDVPLVDIGCLAVLTTALYTVYPLVNYIADGYEFGVMSDMRLQAYSISAAELGTFHFRHVLYIVALGFSYLLFRGKQHVLSGQVRLSTSIENRVIIVGLAVTMAYFTALQVATGVRMNVSYESEAYALNTYLASNLPLLVSQITYKVAGVQFLLKLLLLGYLLQRLRSRACKTILATWVVYELIDAFTSKGSRTGFVLFSLGGIMLYHKLVKKINPRTALIAGSLLLASFLFLGLYRTYDDLGTMRLRINEARGGALSGANEFQAILGTSYDVYQRKKIGMEIPWYLYINDFIAILPPQQLLPFDKVAASSWYIKEIGADGLGVGYMWGAISQCIIGLDWFEVLMRGCALGVVLRLFHGWYAKRQQNFLLTVIYVYLCTKVYYCFRDTTFSIIANVFWEVLPILVIMKLAGVKLHFSPVQRFRDNLRAAT